MKLTGKADIRHTTFPKIREPNRTGPKRSHGGKPTRLIAADTPKEVGFTDRSAILYFRVSTRGEAAMTAR
jgi:hypothetical protein